MLQSLLVPLDGSEFSERSLPLACGLARATGARLHLALVHVAHPPDHFLSNTQFHFEGLDMDEYDTRHREEEQAYLREVMSRIGNGDTHVDSALLEGNVADELASYAQKVNSDVILITTHGHTGLNRMWLGSVADALVRHTTLPLLAIHPAEPGGRPADVSTVEHILVALDGSDMAEKALPAAADLARASGADLTLLHVVSSTATMGPRLFPIMPDDVVTAMEKADAYLDEVAERLRDQGLEVDVQVAEHEVPSHAIVEVARRLGADLIAMATHGYGGLRRALLGSVADKVLRSSPLPVLLVRPQ